MKRRLYLLLYLIIFTALIFLVMHSEVPLKDSYTTEEKAMVDKIIAVPQICQYPTLPTGCEAVAAVMVLRYYGAEITPEEFASEWLSTSEDFYWYEGKFYGPNPGEVFVGDPFSQSAYGCYAMPIVNAINSNSQRFKAKIVETKSIDEICDEYISEGKPILIWATSGMREPKAGDTWYFSDQTEFTWLSGEHCLVMTGYNMDYCFFNDCQSGSTVAYPKSIVQTRFEELGRQAVYIWQV